MPFYEFKLYNNIFMAVQTNHGDIASNGDETQAEQKSETIRKMYLPA